MVDHYYEGGSKTMVDRYHSSNNLGTGPVLFQYYNVYWELISSLQLCSYQQMTIGLIPQYKVISNVANDLL